MASDGTVELDAHCIDALTGVDGAAMSPGESRLLEFVAIRLESMLRRPAVWGSLQSVEERILQLLELRRVLLVPSASVNDTRRFMQTYSKFVMRALDGATAEPLAVQLERRGRSAELTTLMAKFVESELATFLTEGHREAIEDDDGPRSTEVVQGGPRDDRDDRG